MRLAQVPLVEPMRRDSVLLLDLHATTEVVHGLPVVADAAMDPTEVAVHGVVQLPMLLRLEADELFILLVHRQRLLVSGLLHPHSGIHVQKLEEPKTSSLSAQGLDPLADAVCLVDLVVLQVAADEIDGRSQIPVVVQDSRHLLGREIRQRVRIFRTRPGRKYRDLIGRVSRLASTRPHRGCRATRLRRRGCRPEIAPMRDQPSLPARTTVALREPQPAAGVAGQEKLTADRLDEVPRPLAHLGGGAPARRDPPALPTRALVLRAKPYARQSAGRRGEHGEQAPLR
mmetsp:Transcript_59708/g.194893  ORF Transcript_59708/g.194893 Transcript_59708/m.194893 type:complete len:286 (-) Transcript_59708:1113-1970(-)